ncbi:DUF2141 domain-containing protein [Alterisphingorhabdus coralli]|uniref:DUF2141 domain-containing protein n=1 Tax=Alterisphingorhabdus coralli TaxID=3071408 RepID=A0AA97F860_9SPHN|nr:DUF2141 domain-containing protein [Parasphingorhabdus sp. SCSIO 66989]WOE75706.1 DUF2141 domain-containing protein [Parasphingorhabdus sp. SCSIO 66989]
MHKFRLFAPFAAVLLSFTMALPSAAMAQRQKISNDMGKCSSSASGPAVLVEVVGFKNANGRIRVQSYSATKAKWLKKGQWINRIDTRVALRSGKMRFCVPVPANGNYGIAVRHDTDGNGKSGWSDGGGFSRNPDISLTNLKPSVKKTSISVNGGVRRITVVLNYRQGLSIEPWKAS